MGWAELFLLSLLVPLAMGISRLPLWSLFVLPAVAVAVGIVGVLDEPSNYDMRGASLLFAGGAGVAWLCVSFLGRALRDAVTTNRGELGGRRTGRRPWF